MKKLLVMLLMGALIAAGTGAGFGETYRDLTQNPVQIIVNGETISSYDSEIGIDLPAVTVNGRTMMPLKRTFGLFDVDVAWHGEDESITAVTPEGEIIWLQIDNLSAKIGDAEYVLDAAPTLFEDRTFVPLAFVSEAMGVVPKWEASTWSVLLDIDMLLPLELPERMLKDYMHTYEEWENTNYYHNYADSNKSVQTTVYEETADQVLIQAASDVYVDTSEFSIYQAFDGYKYTYTDYGGYETHVVIASIGEAVHKLVFRGFSFDEVELILQEIKGGNV